MGNFRLKIGDKLKVREDLKHSLCVPNGLNDTMCEMRGKIVTVSDFIDINRFRLSEVSWTWSMPMFEEIIEGPKNEQEVTETREDINFERDDLVRIRTLEDLENTYGRDENGIKTYVPFTKDMEKLCGKKFKIRDVFGKFVRLYTNSRKYGGAIGEYVFSSDMIEFYKEKGKTEMIEKSIENSEDDKKIIDEMISKVDVKKFKKILAASFAIAGKNLKGIDKILENWAKAKKDIYILLGNNIKVSKDMEYEADEAYWDEVRNKLSQDFPGIGYILKGMYIESFQRNSYIPFSDYFRKYMPEAKEGMKLTTFLSNVFKNDEFDTALSKYVDESKIKGNIVISIDPIDFLTMSFNQSGWKSCHTISHTGRAKDFGEFVRRNIQLHRRWCDSNFIQT